MKVNGIEFSEIVDVYDNHGYDREVEVLGYDEAGNEYAAVGMESVGELVEIYEDTIVCGRCEQVFTMDNPKLQASGGRQIGSAK